MIAGGAGVRYVHEPFNPKAHRPGVCRARFEREFTYLCARNARPYRADLARCLSFRYGLVEAARTTRSAKGALRTLREAVRFRLSRWRGDRALLKDPHAVFSAEWLADEFDMDVVLLVRHPAAFAGSIKHAGWAFRFEQLLEQPLLMQDHLERFREAIASQASRPGDLVDQAILLWNLINSAVLGFRGRRPGWLHLRHEDLSRDPVRGFRSVFEALRLPFPPSVERRIEAYSGSPPSHVRRGRPEIRRDSRANLRTWRERLTTEEIDRVRRGTEEIARSFYVDEDWEA